MPNPAQHAAPWSKADVATLKKLYKKMTHRELAAKLGRTLNSVESKAKELGITTPVQKSA